MKKMGVDHIELPPAKRPAQAAHPQKIQFASHVGDVHDNAPASQFIADRAATQSGHFYLELVFRQAGSQFPDAPLGAGWHKFRNDLTNSYSHTR
jgi:hypothetical protein